MSFEVTKYFGFHQQASVSYNVGNHARNQTLYFTVVTIFKVIIYVHIYKHQLLTPRVI